MGTSALGCGGRYFCDVMLPASFIYSFIYLISAWLHRASHYEIKKTWIRETQQSHVGRCCSSYDPSDDGRLRQKKHADLLKDFVSGFHEIFDKINRIFSEVSAVRHCKYSFVLSGC